MFTKNCLIGEKKFFFHSNVILRYNLYYYRVTFPDILNLNPFISSTTSQESPGGEEDIGLGIKCDNSSTTDSGTLDDDCIPCDNSLSNSNHSANHDQDDDEGNIKFQSFIRQFSESSEDTFVRLQV